MKIKIVLFLTWMCDFSYYCTEPEYTWSQNTEEVTAQFTLPSGLTKADVYYTLSHDYIDFGIKNGKHLLKGQLHADVEVESSTWTIQKQR